MASSDKCPHCECEGNRLACKICFYCGFKCPGNCACCEDEKESSAAQLQARTGASNEQRETSQKQVPASNGNEQKASTQRKRAPLRPLILRNVKKSMVENQKKAAAAAAAAANNDPESKAENSTINELNTNKANPTGRKSNENKANPTARESNENKVNPSAVKPKFPKAEAATQFSKPEVTNEAKPKPRNPYLDYEKRDNEVRHRLWKRVFFPQWEKLPCEPYISQQIENLRKKSETITREKLKEEVTEMIGDHCLNCHCRNPRESCDICRRTDFQCLGTCQCCLSFRLGQRYMVFVTRGLYKLPNGSLYGGGSVHL